MIFGVIPARGGSKGIPQKNVRQVCGKPLIAWTIEAAQQSVLLDRWVVSTEDPEIARISRRYGAEILNRPPQLATDTTPTLHVLKHALNHVSADIVVLLQPTSPIRSSGLIDRCIRQFQDTQADSLATGFMCKYQEYALGNNLRRQDRTGFFYDDGNVYVIRAAIVSAGEQFGEKIEHVLLDREQNIEVDDFFELWLAEKVLERRSAGNQSPTDAT